MNSSALEGGEGGREGRDEGQEGARKEENTSESKPPPRKSPFLFHCFMQLCTFYTQILQVELMEEEAYYLLSIYFVPHIILSASPKVLWGRYRYNLRFAVDKTETRRHRIESQHQVWDLGSVTLELMLSVSVLNC